MRQKLAKERIQLISFSFLTVASQSIDLLVYLLISLWFVFAHLFLNIHSPITCCCFFGRKDTFHLAPTNNRQNASH